MNADPPTLDCLVIGAGPAGLAAGLYLARYGRSFRIIDAGDPRVASIPLSHNIPFFAEGISGADILARGRAQLARHGGTVIAGEVQRLLRTAEGTFRAEITVQASQTNLEARHVLLATGAEDIEPDLPDLPNAVRQGLVRYCPICDGFEARGQRIAVIGHGARGLGEAAFLASTYSSAVTLLTLGCEDGEDQTAAPLILEPGQRQNARFHGIAIIRQPVIRLGTRSGRLVSVTTADGADHQFDAVYSALGLRPRADLATALGAARDGGGALVIDEHGQTSVPGMYAAGGVAHGLDQVVVAMAHAAAAATAIHNTLRRNGAFGRFGLRGEAEEPRRAG